MISLAEQSRQIGEIQALMMNDSFLKLKRPKEKMTIVVGIIGDLVGDAVTFVSDSENTDGKIKRNVPKISVLEFKNTRVLIGESGHSGLSRRAVDEISRLAGETSIEDAWDIARIAEDAVRTIRSTMLAGFPTSLAMEDVQRYITNNCEFTLLIGCIVKVKGRYVGKMFKIDNVHQIAELINNHYASIGVGREVAEHLLAEYAPIKARGFGSLATAFWVVEKVKQSVSGCGGPTQVAQLSSPFQNDIPELSTFTSLEVERMASKLSELELKSKKERQESIEDLFVKIALEVEEIRPSSSSSSTVSSTSSSST